MDEQEQKDPENGVAQGNVDEMEAEDFSFKSLLDRFYLKKFMLKAKGHNSDDILCVLD